MRDSAQSHNLRTALQTRILALHDFAGQIFIREPQAIDSVRQLLEETRRLLDAEAVVLAVRDEPVRLVGRYATGRDREGWIGQKWPATTAAFGHVVTHRKPLLLVGERGEDPAPFSKSYPMAILAPIIQQGQVTGALWAVRRGSDRFFSADLEMLVEAASVLAWAMVMDESAAKAANARAQLDHLFQDGFDPIVVTDRTGRIIQVNTQAARFFGAPPDELVGIPLGRLHGRDEVLLQPEALPGEQTTSFLSRVGHGPISEAGPDNTRPVEVRVRRLSTTPDETWQWIYHDMTSQEELEQMRQDVTAMLVHDLQSPLGNVISSLELMKYTLARENGNDDILGLLDVASRSSGQLLRLIQSLLDISRLEAGQPLGRRKALSIRKIVQDAYEIEQPNFERRGVRLLRELPETLPPVYVEENVISRVLLNLFDNALKHSGEGYAITVSAEESSDMVELSVSDQGVGIPEDYRETIFEKFQRIKTDPSSKGLGLGLAFCRLAVEAHGGHIWVEEAEGGGARFSFTIPVSRETETAMPAPSAAPVA